MSHQKTCLSATGAMKNFQPTSSNSLTGIPSSVTVICRLGHGVSTAVFIKKEKMVLYDNPYYLNLNGQTYVLTNMDGFIQNQFQDLADKIYDNSYNNVDFVYEVWFIVSQLTVYDLDINQDSEGRYAIEALTREAKLCTNMNCLQKDF